MEPSYLDYIGLYSSGILFIFSLFFLRHIRNFLHFFVYGFIVNNIFNVLLKIFIKDARPDELQKAIETGIVNGSYIGFDKFGMPSCHSQNCGFYLSFITLTLNDPYITTLYASISIMTILQKYFYARNSILQLIIGLLLGIWLGYLTHVISTQYIVGNIDIKDDEYAPI